MNIKCVYNSIGMYNYYRNKIPRILVANSLTLTKQGRLQMFEVSSYL